MSIELKVLCHQDIDLILDYEKSKLQQSQKSEVEQMAAEWQSKWRREALEHYLPQGWSMVARDESGKLLGYFLAQPFLFYRGMTQVLWVEHLQFESTAIIKSLIDTAYRLSREKHLQAVLFANETEHEVSEVLKLYSRQRLSPATIEIPTTKGGSH